jgi:hypothetical protein
MKTALLMLIFVAAGGPVLAKSYHPYQNGSGSPESGSPE